MWWRRCWLLNRPPLRARAEDCVTGLLYPDLACGADDLLFIDGGAYLDTSGFTFTVAGPGSDFAGDVNIALLLSSDATDDPYTTPYEIPGSPSGTLSVTPVGVAEPASAGLAIAGMAAMVMVARTRRRHLP